MPSAWIIAGRIVGGRLAPRWHIANTEARTIARELLSGEKIPVDYHGGPPAIFSFPKVTGVGFTERQARDQGVRYVAATHHYHETQ